MSKQRTRGQFRIIGGRWRARRLAFLEQPGLRPTPDRVRETLFNWLAPTLPGARCLDLFAGSGALGLEALSRGASAVTFVDRDRSALRRIDEHLLALGASSGQTWCSDWQAFIRRCQDSFDLIFADPPFASDYVPQLCTLLGETGALSPQGKLYLEFSRSQVLAPPPPWTILKQGHAGQVGYALLTQPAE